MTEREFEQRLAGAVERVAPNNVEAVLSRCGAQNGKMIPLEAKGKKRRVTRWLAAACAALVLISGGGGVVYYQSHAVTSVVSLDVNPSIELQVNRSERVLSCIPVNQEAREILLDMGEGKDLEGTKLDVAVNAIVGALVRNGYLDSVSSAILISVEDSNQERATRLQMELTGTVDEVLQSQSSGAAVLSQALPQNAQVEEQARSYNISTGKSALVTQASMLNSELPLDALVQLSAEELKDLVELGAPGMPIGREAAIQAVLAYAGITETDIISVEADPELDDNPANYEVELYHKTMGELEYTVDAWTGSILSGRADVAQSNQSGQNNQAAAGGQSGSQGEGNASSQSGGDIGPEQALAFALNHAGVDRSNISGLKMESEWDDGRLEYEIEFRCGGTEYEYTLDGMTGSVLEWEMDSED